MRTKGWTDYAIVKETDVEKISCVLASYSFQTLTHLFISPLEGTSELDYLSTLGLTGENCCSLAFAEAQTACRHDSILCKTCSDGPIYLLTVISGRDCSTLDR